MATALDERAPSALKTLLALFSSLEFSLSSLALYQRTADWDAIKLAIESSRQTTFTKEHLQQILWLLPNAYALSWSRPTRKRSRGSSADADDREVSKPVLILRRQRLVASSDPEAQLTDQDSEAVTSNTTSLADAKSADAIETQSESIGDRIAIFTQRLNEFIAAKASELGTGFTDYEMQEKLQEISVPTADLPEKSAVSSHTRAQERLEKVTAAQIQVTSKEVQDALDAPVPDDLKTLPKWLVDKVRRQEQQSKKVSQRSDQAQRHRLYTTLPQSDQIQSYTLVQRKHVFLLADLAKGISVRAPIRDQIVEQIHLLESLVPFWITVFFSDGKEYVKLSKSAKYNTVKTELRTAVAAIVGGEQ